MPLVKEVVQRGLEGNTKRLGRHGCGIVAGVAEPQAQGEFGAAGEIKFSHEGNIAIQGGIVLPSHFEVVKKSVHPSLTPTYPQESLMNGKGTGSEIAR